MKYYAPFIVFLLTLNSLCAQVKYEHEAKVTFEEVPNTALQFVRELQLDSKIRWYRETGLNSTSIEAKTKFKGRRYSIEFNTKGELEDIEITISKKKLPQKVYNEIESYLREDLEKFKWEKVQIQYSGTPEAVVQQINSGNSSQGLIVQYELVISAKLKKKYQKFEYLFSDAGKFIIRKNIVLKNTDNLEY